jgi:hypothetical protein
MQSNEMQARPIASRRALIQNEEMNGNDACCKNAGGFAGSLQRVVNASDRETHFAYETLSG